MYACMEQLCNEQVLGEKEFFQWKVATKAVHIPISLSYNPSPKNDVKNIR